MEYDFVSNQISKYQTNKGLIEFLDNMNPASVENYAHIHAEKEKAADGRRIYSRIGVVLQDYSNGTGENCVRVRASLTPEEIKYFFYSVCNMPTNFNYPGLNDQGKVSFQTKIFGNPDENGRSRVTKFRLARQQADANGEVRKLPWIFEIHNGTGIKVPTKIGGFYMKGESFALNSKGRAYILLSDFDFFSLISAAKTYIDVWEIANGSRLIREGIKAREEYFRKTHSNVA